MEPTRPLSRFKNRIHHLNSITSGGKVHNMIAGLHELLCYMAKDDIFESEVLEYLDPETLLFSDVAEIDECPCECESCSRALNAKTSRTYRFVAGLKLCISEFINPYENLTADTFCKLNQFLEVPKMEGGCRTVHAAHYYVQPQRCQCKEGVHDWLEGFIGRIVEYSQIERLDPLYEISRLYIGFITRQCFGKQTNQIGMILLQVLAIQWMHYTVIPFDENENEYLRLMKMRPEIAVSKFAQFLEKVLTRSIENVLSRSMGLGSSPELSDAASTEEVIRLKKTVDLPSADSGPSSVQLDGYISGTGALLKRVSSSLESVVGFQSLGSPDDVKAGPSPKLTTLPIFQSGISKSVGPKRRRVHHSEYHITGRKACVKNSADLLCAANCDDCGWKLAHANLFKTLNLAPKLGKSFNHTEGSKGISGKPTCEGAGISAENIYQCPSCGTLGFLYECYSCGFGMSWFQNYMEGQPCSSKTNTCSSSRKEDIPFECGTSGSSIVSDDCRYAAASRAKAWLKGLSDTNDAQYMKPSDLLAVRYPQHLRTNRFETKLAKEGYKMLVQQQFDQIASQDLNTDRTAEDYSSLNHDKKESITPLFPTRPLLIRRKATYNLPMRLRLSPKMDAKPAHEACVNSKEPECALSIRRYSTGGLPVQSNISAKNPAAMRNTKRSRRKLKHHKSI